MGSLGSVSNWINVCSDITPKDLYWDPYFLVRDVIYRSTEPLASLVGVTC